MGAKTSATCRLSIVAFGASLVAATPAPSTLVIRAQDGEFGPGAAVSWKVKGDAVTFTLADGTDPDTILDLLENRLPKARIGLQGDQLTVAGMTPTVLLEWLSTLSLEKNEWAVLGELAETDAPLEMSGPEAGGSIRASHRDGKSPWVPTADGIAKPQVIKDHNSAESFQAEVVAIHRGEFPLVGLELRIGRGAKVGPLKGRLKAGAIVRAVVVFATNAAGIDFLERHNRRNLGANYLVPGDRVTVHALPKEDGMEIDFIERHGTPGSH